MVFITIKPLDYKFRVDLQKSITIAELFISIKDQHKISNSIENWICFSEDKQQQLNKDDQLQPNSDEKLLIFAYQPKIWNQDQSNQEISLSLNIEFNSQIKTLSRLFKKNNQIQDILDLALAECSLLFKKDVSIEIRIFGQQMYGTQIKFNTIQQMQLRQETTIDIKIICPKNDQYNMRLAQLQTLKQQCQQNLTYIKEKFNNIKFKFDVILENTLAQCTQLLESFDNNINQVQIQYSNDLNYLNQIDKITAQINKIKPYVQQIECLTNEYTKNILENQQKILEKYYNKSESLILQSTATIRDVINQKKLTLRSQLRFSDSLIYQIDLDEQINKFVGHTLYIERNKMQIKQFNENQISVKVYVSE